LQYRKSGSSKQRQSSGFGGGIESQKFARNYVGANAVLMMGTRRLDEYATNGGQPNGKVGANALDFKIITRAARRRQLMQLRSSSSSSSTHMCLRVASCVNPSECSRSTKDLPSISVPTSNCGRVLERWGEE
jgi:hypothetical protein